MSNLAWADSYDDAETYDDDRREDYYDEIVQNLTAVHELWKDLLKTWAGSTSA
jgi:hypothetical protein